jgi:hypothetical protein
LKTPQCQVRVRSWETVDGHGGVSAEKPVDCGGELCMTASVIEADGTVHPLSDEPTCSTGSTSQSWDGGTGRHNYSRTITLNGVTVTDTVWASAHS